MAISTDLPPEFFENNFQLFIYLQEIDKTRKYPEDFLILVWETFRDNYESCFDKIKNEQDAQNCLDEMHYYYKKAEEKIRDVENGDEIYRGLKIDPKKYNQFKSDLNGREWDTLDYWMSGKRTKYVPQRAGKYWTWRIDNANAFGKEISEDERDVDDVVLVAENPRTVEKYADHEIEIDENATKSHLMVYQESENEIRLKDNSEVFLKQICNWQKGYMECEDYNDLINVGSHYYIDEFQHFKSIDSPLLNE